MKFSRSFHFTLDSDHQELPWPGDKVTVVSLVGKSSSVNPSEKQALFDQLTGKSVQFPSALADRLSSSVSKSSAPNDKSDVIIQGFFDGSERVVYLHLISPLDSDQLLNSCQNLQRHLDGGVDDEAPARGFLASWSDRRLSLARALLLLFNISHVIVWHQPTAAVFDVGSLRLLQCISVCRRKLQHIMSEWLSVDCVGEYVTPGWVSAARMCTPRLLFAFSRCPSPIAAASQSARPRLLQQLQRSLERQVYRLMRRSRLLSPSSSSSGGSSGSVQPLFALPANQPFVWISSTELAIDALHSDMKLLQKLCLSPDTAALDECSVSGDLLTTSSLSELVNQHVKSAVGPGFDDSTGKHTQPPFFCLPVGVIWYDVARLLYRRLVETELATAAALSGCRGMGVSSSTSGGYLKVMLNFCAALSTDIRFSEVRCARALPLAVAAYQESIPARYSRATHSDRLAAAVAVFHGLARGPGCDQYVRRLQNECISIWESGRQMCERLSLTGNPCINPVHKLPKDACYDDQDEQNNQDLDASRPVMQHCSGVCYLATCNCGRTQVQKNDPFLVRYANYDFYEEVSHQCCGHLPRLPLSVFQITTGQEKATIGNSGQKRSMISDERAKLSDSQMMFSSGNLSHSSFGLGLSQEDLSPVLSPANSEDESQEGSNYDAPEDEILHDGSSSIDEESYAPESSAEPVTAGRPGSPDDSAQTGDKQQHDEYLYDMLTTGTPLHLLPIYPSFCIICAGPSSNYSHAVGLHRFLPGSSWLVPWELRLKSGSQKASSSRPPPRRFGRRIRDYSDLYAKTFIGFEYECPRGHRFLMASRDRILKASGSAHMKESSSALVNSEMPLFFNCPCSRSEKPFVGQLMRIHAVTPKSAVRVTLNVRVQPRPPNGAVYVPICGGTSVELAPSSYWICRLPHVYVSGDELVAPPRQQVGASGSGRILSGVFGYVVRDESR